MANTKNDERTSPEGPPATQATLDEIQQRATAAIAEQEARLATARERLQAATAQVTRLDGAHRQAEMLAQSARDRLATAGGALARAKAEHLLATGTPNEASAQETVAHCVAEQELARTTFATATQRVQDAQDELSAARVAWLDQQDAKTRLEGEVQAVVTQLQTLQREAHLERALAELSRIREELAAGEAYARDAEAALTEARAAQDATRATIADRMRPYPEIAEQWRPLLTPPTSRVERILAGYLAWLEVLEREGGEHYDGPALLHGQSIAQALQLVPAAMDRILGSRDGGEVIEAHVAHIRTLVSAAALERKG
jgi:hypothetical protein